MDLLQTQVKLMGKLLQKNESGLFSLLFSGLQPQSALSTPNILHAVKPPVKICFSLPHIAGHSLKSWKSDSSWKAPSETSHSSPLTIISQSFSFSSFDRMFSCQAKHVIPFKLFP